MNTHLKIGDEYTKGEIESIFETNFGWLIKGITLRKGLDGNSYIILFSKKSSTFGSRIVDNILYFCGERQDKGQKPTIANKALMESNETGRRIYGFRKEGKRAVWKYLGILKLIDYEYVDKDGFKTFEFRLKITNNIF